MYSYSTCCMHHLSVDNDWVLAALEGCSARVVGLRRHRLYGNELQGSGGGVIWIWGREGEFTHWDTTNTSNQYIVSQRGTNCHTSLPLCVTDYVKHHSSTLTNQAVDAGKRSQRIIVGFTFCISVCPKIPYQTVGKLESPLALISSWIIELHP